MSKQAEQIKQAWQFERSTRRGNRDIVVQRNTITGQTREIDANTGRTLPRR